MKLFKIYFILFFLISFISFINTGWSQNIPPKIEAIGNQAYCPLSQINIVADFNIIDPDDTEIEALFIQISTGYVNGQDKLTLNNSHPNINTNWSNSEGKLTLKSATSGLVSYIDMISAVKDVVFESSSLSVNGEKLFSFTIGDANYLPSTGHYYEYIADIGITWINAKTAADLRTYYGLQGYLATIISADESQLAGEQAKGAGWIGGSDQETEGVWKWVTGPESGTIFWNGVANGSAPAGIYSYWNTGEPNQMGDEDYAHITAPNVGIIGSWNDLSNTGAISGDYQPKGYIVEYGGTAGDPDLDLSASTRIYVPIIKSHNAGKNCGPGTVTLTATASSGSILWFESLSSVTPLFTGNSFTTPVLSSTKEYYILASENGCIEGLRETVIATINDIPIISNDVTLKNCDEDGIPDGFTDFNLEEAKEIITNNDNSLTVTYHILVNDANTAINPLIPFPFNNSISDTVYARVENNSGCYDISIVHLQVSTTSFPKGFQEELMECDADSSNDGIFSFDLTEASKNILDQLPEQNLIVQYYRNLSDAQLEQNEIQPQTAYRNEIPYSQTLYIRVESNDNGDCYGIGPHLVLTVHPLPEFDVDPTAIVCLNLSSITLATYNPVDNYSYKWFNESGAILSNESTVTVSSGGKYTVIATSDTHCMSFPKTVEVTESIIATIDSNDITVTDNLENNTIEINIDNLGIGIYEFALDDEYGPYQTENLFEYVIAGKHTVFIRDINGCGTANIDVFVIGYPKFFTPNGDGINDTWQVDGVISQPNSKIYIYDKFGKLLKQIESKGEGWDGLYRGNQMPSTDYWYMVQLDDGRIHKGHFSLIRR